MLNILKGKESNKLTKEEVYEFLSIYLKDQLSLSHRISTNEETFSKPSWSEFQAYQIGMQKAFQRVLDLIPDQGTNDN
ncbi:MAG: hypothetical protein WC471_06095 [Candidatus Woesearchaeota archaeon]|jgi:hypothetical protein